MPTVATIDRALDVLLMFAESGRGTLGVTEIAQALGLSKAVVHRALSSFRAKGFVELDELSRRYRLGPGVLHLGRSFLERIDIHTLARPVIERLSEETGETSTVSIRTGFTRVYIDQVTPERDVKMVVQLGRPWPLHAGASSKAFLAFLPPDVIDQYLSGALERLTPRTITSSRVLRAELARIRRRGYAESTGERLTGAAAVAAPVLGHDGGPEAVVSVSGPADRFTRERGRAARLLLEASRNLSRQLGGRN